MPANKSKRSKKQKQDCLRVKTMPGQNKQLQNPKYTKEINKRSWIDLFIFSI